MKKNTLVETIRSFESLKGKELQEAVSSLIEQLNSVPAAKSKKHRFIELKSLKLEDNVKYPPQMLECFKILEEQGKKKFELNEVKEVFATAGERLNTKQDPYRIYAFYQKRMQEEGWISRETEVA